MVVFFVNSVSIFQLIKRISIFTCMQKHSIIQKQSGILFFFPLLSSMLMKREYIFTVARRFSQVLKRQTSLNHLCQAARTVINSTEITSQMLDDWYSVDLNSIIKQTLYTTESNSNMDNVVIVKRKQTKLCSFYKYTCMP